MTGAYMVIKNEYGFVVWDEKCKIFFDKTNAMNYMFELLNDPEQKKFIPPREIDDQPYKIIEVNIEP